MTENTLRTIEAIAFMMKQKPGATQKRGRAWAGIHPNYAVLLPLLMAMGAGEAIAEGGTRCRLDSLENNYQQMVLKGWSDFQTSFAADGVACVDCHLHHGDMAAWARAYPKVQTFDGTLHRVKTLKRVVLEALDKHSDLSPDQQAKRSEALVAYISCWGKGMPVVPSRSRAYEAPDAERSMLDEAVKSGEEAVGQYSCGTCHNGTGQEAAPSLDRAMPRFPHYSEIHGKVVSLHSFLKHHLQAHGVENSEEVITRIAAYLARLAKGSPYTPGKSMQQTGGE